MKSKKTRSRHSLVSVTLCIALMLTMVSTVLAASIANSGGNDTASNETDGIAGVIPIDSEITMLLDENGNLHKKLNFSAITEEGGDPPEYYAIASAFATEKNWYEYINYSTEPVGELVVSANSRIAFFDPYDYDTALVMRIDDTFTDWASANSITATYQTSKTVTTGFEKSSSYSSTLEQALGPDTSKTVVTSEGEEMSKYHSDVKSVIDAYEVYDWGLNETEIRAKCEEIGSELGTDIGGIVAKVIGSAKVEESLANGSTQHWTNTPEVTNNTTEDGWQQGKSSSVDTSTVTSTIADRFATSTGSSSSTNQSWSTTDSVTISKTFEAGYFNSSGAPLQWKIVKYTVQMPMYYTVQFCVDDEWIIVSDGYALLTTIEGTCRSWLQNNTAYYEHWGTGEPVTWNEFWGRFFTESSLKAAYQSKLYPDR